ncbi:S8 family serine peptidase [Pseudanabaena sp. PCC 6802]|uniref:S8 family serine peptidase n=1 Tax=Pseudanabaena sp. PCC 6802 TaxID=118173 RepID=UPI0019309646|nr:S8 family serine peptidase [Pseudanabaena sp. PCC 6802]
MASNLALDNQPIKTNREVVSPASADAAARVEPVAANGLDTNAGTDAGVGDVRKFGSSDSDSSPALVDPTTGEIVAEPDLNTMGKMGFLGSTDSDRSTDVDAIATEVTAATVAPLPAPELEPSNQPLVGIVDTGFNFAEVNVKRGNISLGWDRVGKDNDPLIKSGEGSDHGTHILSAIAAQPDETTGVGGINPDAPLWLGRAVGSGEWAESLVEFVDAARAAGQKNAIANLSFDLTQRNIDGSVTTRTALTPQEEAALAYAQENQVLVVVAAGNQNGEMSALGQASLRFDNVISVGAIAGENRAAYASYGNGLDVVADGGTPENPVLSRMGDCMGAMAGTSVAAAQVTGVASKVWAANPDLNYQQVAKILEQSASDRDIPGWDRQTGFGQVDEDSAVALARNTKAEALQARQSNGVVPVKFDAELMAESGVVASERAADVGGAAGGFGGGFGGGTSGGGSSGSGGGGTLSGLSTGLSSGSSSFGSSSLYDTSYSSLSSGLGSSYSSSTSGIGSTLSSFGSTSLVSSPFSSSSTSGIGGTLSSFGSTYSSSGLSSNTSAAGSSLVSSMSNSLNNSPFGSIFNDDGSLNDAGKSAVSGAGLSSLYQQSSFSDPLVVNTLLAGASSASTNTSSSSSSAFGNYPSSSSVGSTLNNSSLKDASASFGYTPAYYNDLNSTSTSSNLVGGGATGMNSLANNGSGFDPNLNAQLTNVDLSAQATTPANEPVADPGTGAVADFNTQPASDPGTGAVADFNIQPASPADNNNTTIADLAHNPNSDNSDVQILSTNSDASSDPVTPNPDSNGTGAFADFNQQPAAPTIAPTNEQTANNYNNVTGAIADFNQQPAAPAIAPTNEPTANNNNNGNNAIGGVIVPGASSLTDPNNAIAPTNNDNGGNAIANFNPPEIAPTNEPTANNDNGGNAIGGVVVPGASSLTDPNNAIAPTNNDKGSNAIANLTPPAIAPTNEPIANNDNGVKDAIATFTPPAIAPTNEQIANNDNGGNAISGVVVSGANALTDPNNAIASTNNNDGGTSGAFANVATSGVTNTPTTLDQVVNTTVQTATDFAQNNPDLVSALAVNAIAGGITPKSYVDKAADFVSNTINTAAGAIDRTIQQAAENDNYRDLHTDDPAEQAFNGLVAAGKIPLDTIARIWLAVTTTRSNHLW